MTTPNMSHPESQPLKPTHTGASDVSAISGSAAGHQGPVLSRRNSVMNVQIDTATIGVPLSKQGQEESDKIQGQRPRLHKRSLTGDFTQKNVGSGGQKASWPVGDEETWRKALATDSSTSLENIIAHTVHHVTTTLARQPSNIDELGAYRAIALTIRDELIRKWNATTSYHTSRSPKRVYYLSLEFLMGRSLDNAVINLGMRDKVAEAMGRLGFSFEELLDYERDAGLGNGGLGRLASCYMDASATLELPMWGYGLRYSHGIFRQLLDSNTGAQLEVPDPYLEGEYPWEIARTDVVYRVRFYGTCERQGGKGKAIWYGGQEVNAVAYDVPVPGWKTENVNNIRLWSSKPIAGFDFQSFNAGNYEQAVASAQSAENITQVLYPNDSTWQGKELRLKQQYLWVCASLQDILRRFRKLDLPWKALPEMVVIQCNDTHPTMGIVELMRVLLDEEDVEWDEAWAITTRVFAFTNHTVLSEALETWPVPLLQQLLPRHLAIIFDINLWFLQEVGKKFQDKDMLRRVSIVEESSPQRIRMANLAVISCFKVNGVAALHSQLVKSQLFPDFVKIFGPDRFQNVTNGITHRRFLHQCNPELSALITSCIGDGWIKDLSELAKMEQYADNAQVLQTFRAVKERNKLRLAEIVEREMGITLDPTAMFTVQAKRMHEYKRQTLNILGIIYRYLVIKKASPSEKSKIVPHVAFFAGKAAPGYFLARSCVQLINNVSKVVNNDKDVGDLLKVVFLADYSVSTAEILMPAGDVSVQISTAGTEASGTGNMKLALNGALLLATVDGANVEIAEACGEEQCSLFGHLCPDVDNVRFENSMGTRSLRERSAACADAVEAVDSGMFAGGGHADYGPLMDSIRHTDYYCVSNDFDSYLAAEKVLDDLYSKSPKEWTHKAFLTMARMAFFSADRAVQTYADEIWNVEAEPVPEPVPVPSSA